MSPLVPDVSEFLTESRCPARIAVDALDDAQLVVNITAALDLPHASPTKIAKRLGIGEKAVRAHRDRTCRCARASHD